MKIEYRTLYNQSGILIRQHLLIAIRGTWDVGRVNSVMDKSHLSTRGLEMPNVGERGGATGQERRGKVDIGYRVE